MLPPKHVDDFGGTCWLVSLATFLQISFYEAMVLMFGGPRAEYSDLGITLDDMEKRIAKLGFVRARKDYKNANEPRLVIGCYRNRDGGYFCTLHAVVWDPEKKERIDPQEYDSLKSQNARIVRVYRRVANAEPVKTGCRISPIRAAIMNLDETLALAA